MTDDQVNLVVQHLCEQLHLALRLKGGEAHPPNAKDIGLPAPASGFRPIAWAEVHGQSRGVDPWDGPIAYRPIFM